MKIYYKNDKIEYPSPAIALGNFDGVHMGHKAVIKNASDLGESYGVLLFKTHSSKDVKVITPLNEKLRILSEIGLDFAYIVDFDDDFKNMSCKEFCRFLSEIGVEYVSVGYDYRCGKGAMCDADSLKEELALCGIKTVIADPVFCESEPVKSTGIREWIMCGNIEKVNALMTRPMRISGTVVEGLQNGIKLGFPTANIDAKEEQLLPLDGVYCSLCFVDGIEYPSLLNIGKNPTFNAQKRTIEVHIINFDGNLYGKEIDIEIYSRIRGEIKFDTMAELSKQIESDRQFVLAWREGK